MSQTASLPIGTRFDDFIDGRGGSDADMLDEEGWQAYLAKVQQAAETFRD